NKDALQGVRTLPVLRRYLHYHMVLVERIVDGRNLTLAERVIEGVVDGGGRQSKARGAIAIDDEINGEATLLLIGIRVGELARFLQRRRQPRRPAVDLCGIAARQGELKCRIR